MYEEYLKKRMDAHGNGIITQVIQPTPSTATHSETRVRFEIYDKEGSYEITFGRTQPLLISSTSRASAIANVVGYAWELIHRGASCVIVDILDLRFTCNLEQKLKVTPSYLQYVLRALSERVDFELPDATRAVRVWTPELPFDGIELQYLPPDRPGSINPYLGNLGKYLSLVFNSVVQINQKPIGTVTTVNKEFLPGYTTITHIEQLQGFVHHKLQDFSTTLSRYGLVDLVESRRMRLTGPATVYFDISLGNRTYRLPLWSMVGITSDVLDEVKRYLDTHLQDFVVRVSLATHSLVGR